VIECVTVRQQTRQGQFVPTAGEENWLRRLRMANEIQCIKPMLNNVTLFTTNELHFDQLIILSYDNVACKVNTNELHLDQFINRFYDLVACKVSTNELHPGQLINRFYDLVACKVSTNKLHPGQFTNLFYDLVACTVNTKMSDE